MGVDLSSKSGKGFSCNWAGWRFLLSLANRNGWEPRGTVDPYPPAEGLDPGPWDGSYGFNNGQMVTAEDAEEIANALERHLQDTPDATVDQLDEAKISWIREFIEFCREGPFRIF